MTSVIVPTLFDYSLSDTLVTSHTITRADAEQLFSFFSGHKIFKWNESHNGCEARADAVCVLLDAWHIPNCKAWVFGGKYLKNHVGALKKNWNYHVAPVLQVKEETGIVFYVLDPATANCLQPIADWAAAITMLPHSYHFFMQSHWYIFRGNDIKRSNWHTRNRQNRKWMIQGLAGINSLSARGKAQLCFNKGRIKNTDTAFRRLKKLSAFISVPSEFSQDTLSNKMPVSENPTK